MDQAGVPCSPHPGSTRQDAEGQKDAKHLKEFCIIPTLQVILVVRDKAVLEDKEKLADDLQKYISLNTYLDSEDPWFWQKLR